MQHNTCLNTRTSDGATPLLLAISLKKYEIADVLLKNGANPNICDQDGITPLHLACQVGNLDIVNDLLQKGAKVYIKTLAGNYPIALAINNEHHTIAKRLFTIMYE